MGEERRTGRGRDGSAAAYAFEIFNRDHPRPEHSGGRDVASILCPVTPLPERAKGASGTQIYEATPPDARSMNPYIYGRLFSRPHSSLRPLPVTQHSCASLRPRMRTHGLSWGIALCFLSLTVAIKVCKFAIILTWQGRSHARPRGPSFTDPKSHLTHAREHARPSSTPCHPPCEYSY